MNKSELIDTMAADLESRQQAKDALESILNNITAALQKKDSVTLTGFGTFKIRKQLACQNFIPAVRFRSLTPLFERPHIFAAPTCK